jgi:threonine dehydratase
MNSTLLFISELSAIQTSVKPFISRTPVLKSSGIDILTGCEILFKCENFQKTGSFKIRGASCAVNSLAASELNKGVITHSSGNFAQALAYAAKLRGIKAVIVMPENVTPVKRDAVITYGAEIIYSGNKPEDRENKCGEVMAKSGAVFIHPSNDINVIKGHSTCAAEIIDQAGKLDYIVVPVGGGGLISGISLGFNLLSPGTKIIGAEPANAGDAYESLREGKIIPQTNPDTIADGLRTSLGPVTFPIIQQFVSEIILVSEEEIISAMRVIWERMKIIAEPSSAVTLAAILKNKDQFAGKKVGAVISGGNVDLNKLPF